MKIDLRTDEAKVKDVIKEQKKSKTLEKAAAKRRSRGVKEDKPPRPTLRSEPYEIGQRYRVVVPIDDFPPGTILIVAGVNEERRAVTMLYHCTGEPSRTILLAMTRFDCHQLTFMEPETTFDTGQGEDSADEMSRRDWATIIGMFFVAGFVVTAMVEAIKWWLF